MRLQQSLQRFRNQFKTKRRQEQPKKRSRRLQLEHLEDRTLLSTIVWTNKGNLNNDSDGFNAVFGSNADIARSDVQAAIDEWASAIVNFNFTFPFSNTFNLNISMGGTGNGASAFSPTPWFGKPVSGSITIGSGSDGHGGGWYLDPTPYSSEEFRGTIVNNYAMDATPGGPADGLGDLETVALAEVTHEMGQFNESVLGVPLLNWSGTSYLQPTGQADAATVGSLYTFNGPDTQGLYTTDNGGNTDTGSPIHTAEPDAANVVTVNGTTYYGSQNNGNAIYEFSRRYLLSNLTVQALGDVYGYTVQVPSQNAYINYDPNTGNLLVRGGSHGENIYPSQANPSDDTITIGSFTFFGLTFVTASVSIGNPTPGTGPNITYSNAFLAGGVTSITVDGNDGAGIIDVEGTVPGIPVTINESSGNTTVNISRSAEFLDNIQENVFVNGGSGVDTLNVYDQNNPRSDTWTITSSSVTRSFAATIFYNGQSNIVINGGSGNLTYNVLSTEAFLSTSIDTGPGTDTVNVQSTGIFSTLTINNLFSTTNQDTVNIGSLAPSLGGTLANIAGTVNVANSSGGGTTLNIDDSGDTTGQLFFITSGQISGTAFPAGVINYNGGEVTLINLLGGDGGNNFEVHSTASGTTTSINTNDTSTFNTNNHVDISSNAPALGGTLANIAGPVNVSSSSGSTTLTVDDSGDTTGQTFTVTNNSITGTEFTGAINYSQVSTLTFDGGSGVVDTYNVQSTAASTMTNLLLHGSSTVKVGSLAPSLGGTLANIAGPLNVSNASAMTVDDSGDGTAQTATITNNSISGTWSPATITYAGVGTLRIHGGFGGDTINVQGTSATTNLVLAGSTTVNVGNAGSVQGILGALNIENPPSFNTIVVDDSADTTARHVTLSTLGANLFDSEGNTDPWGQIIGLAPANINYEYFDTTSLTIKGGGGTGVHTWNVLATGVSTTINGGSGNDTFNVGSGGSTSIIDAIGALTVNGGLGTNILNVDDHGNPNPQSFSLSSTVLSRSGGVSITYGTIKTLNLNAGGNDTLTVLLPVPTTTTNFNAGGGVNTLIGANTTNTWDITAANHGTLGKITFNNVQNLTGGTGNDTFKLIGAGASIAGDINGGGGLADKLDYSGNGGGVVTVNLQTGTATSIGGTFSNIESLVGSGSGNNTLTGANTTNLWTISSANGGKVNTVTFSGISNLVGGTGLDVFKFTGVGKVSGTISGGGAPAFQGDWLDYSSVLYPVSVDLSAGTATSTGGVSNIQNVHGGNFGNTLKGNAQGNILIGGLGGGTITGGSGRSLLIGDKGNANIFGGSASGDILIADSITFDSMTTAHELALMSILAEWQSADSFTDRFNDINKGTVYVPGSHLNGTNVLKWGTTAKDDAAPDVARTVTAASPSGVDWFFVDVNDIVGNFALGDHKNNT